MKLVLIHPLLRKTTFDNDDDDGDNDDGDNDDSDDDDDDDGGENATQKALR